MNEDRLNPWKSVWFQPRATVRQQVNRAPLAYVTLLAIMSGVSNYFSDALSDVDGLQNLFTILFVGIFLAPLFGVINLHIGASLFRLTGRWLGGHGRDIHLRTMLAWSSLPLTLGGVFIIIPLFFYGVGISSTSGELVPLPIDFISNGLGVALGIWSLVISCVGLSEVHGFSIWKAIGSGILVLLLVVVFIGAIFAVCTFAMLNFF